jgi:hypothetical protein
MGIFDDQVNVFTTYHARLEFRAKLMGGIPTNPRIIEGWLRAKAGIEDEVEVRQAMLRTLRELDPDTEFDPGASFEDLIKASEKLAASTQTNGFKHDDRGLYIEARQVKAALKESTNILFPYTKGKDGHQWGITKKTPRSFVAERVFINPDRLHVGVAEPSGIELMIGHVSGKDGKRSTITYHEYVDRPTIECDVMVAENAVTADQWARLWVHCQENGIGALRSQGHGRFEVTEWKRV